MSVKLLCHEYRCIFVHVPKVAGQSIEHVFTGLLELEWEDRGRLLLRPNDDPAAGPPKLAHLKAAEYVSCGHVTQEQYDSYYKFAFVRNPWDRMVSFYKYFGFTRRMGFKQYVFGEFMEKQWEKRYWFVCSQVEYLFAGDRQMVDFIGRYERLQDDFDQVCSRIGLPPTRLPHINKAGRRRPGEPQEPVGLIQSLRALRGDWHQRENTFENYSDYYDDETRQYVAGLYRSDIETFQYEFGA